MKIRSSDISKQQELYNSIHPPITPSIFSTATQTLNHSRSLLEFTDNNDVFSSPLPLAPNNLKRKGNDDKEVNDDDTDEMSTDSTNCRQIKAMKKAPRSIAPLSSPPSPPPNNLISSPTYNKLSHFNIASSPDTHSAHNQLTDNTTDTAEPWKHINYSLYADIDVDESMF
ncbi:hypothetical protein E3P99_00345 [Wallemia hederae]|uniref:Uncharacterized protein n=1 Tax=Wallemia hederae TaxID=1540922 RepID=A0A4T0FVW4_9BASI|nr:hypothetical protein E3P99_00345 [Wallemia hederae]